MSAQEAAVVIVENSGVIRMHAIQIVHAAGYEALQAWDAGEAFRVPESWFGITRIAHGRNASESAELIGDGDELPPHLMQQSTKRCSNGYCES